MKSQPNTIRTLVTAAAMTLAFAGVASAASPTDAWITSKAKVALLTTEGVSASAVNVDTVDRQITLHGSVGTAAEKQKAEEAVRTVQGVSKVRNLLQVVPPANQNEVERADAEISTEVKAALTRQTSLADSSITVQSVNKGVVLLAGEATNLTDHLTAVQTARSVPGVRRVASEIQSSDQLADSMIWRDDTSAKTAAGDDARVTVKQTEVVKDDPSIKDRAVDAKDSVKENAKDAGNAVTDTARDTGNAIADATRSTTDAASDMYVTSMVKMRLLADESTPAMDINVDTDDGKVTLFGIVPTAEAKAEAEAEARKVGGVKSVKNDLQVVADSRKPAVEAKDAEVASNVEAKLKERDTLKDVSIDVKNCVVRLTGSVPTGEERVEAMQVARAQRGVCAVKNEIRIQ